MPDVAEVFRYYNIVVSVVIAIVGTPRLRDFLTRGGEEQMTWMALILLNVSAFWGTFESLRGGYPAGVRVYILSTALTWLLVAVLYTPLAEWKARHSAPEETSR